MAISMTKERNVCLYISIMINTFCSVHVYFCVKISVCFQFMGAEYFFFITPEYLISTHNVQGILYAISVIQKLIKGSKELKML